MMQYFFHSIDGKIICDEEGVELVGDDDALARATHEARVLAAESILADGTLRLHERIEITDGNGRKVAAVTLRDAVSIAA